MLGKADILFDLGNAAEGKKIYAELYKATDKDWNFGRLDDYNKYRLTVKLAEWSIEDGDCKSALDFLEKTKSYNYGACGRQILADREYVNQLREKCIKLLGK